MYDYGGNILTILQVMSGCHSMVDVDVLEVCQIRKVNMGQQDEKVLQYSSLLGNH